MSVWKLFPARPFIIGHRGSPVSAPENTLASFEHAIRAGADAIELDVQLTRDRSVVVIHDFRLERTTTGRGDVSSHTLDSLRAYSAGSRFGKEFSAEKIPTLDEVFELVQGRVGINIELKQQGVAPNIFLLNETIKAIRSHRAEEYVLLSSFHHPLIRRAQNVAPEIPRAILASPLQYAPSSARKQSERADASFFFCSKRMARKSTVTLLHARNIGAGVYSINTEAELERMLRFGIDCIFTDMPEALIVWLKKAGIRV